jgi:hypothetical protein
MKKTIIASLLSLTILPAIAGSSDAEKLRTHTAVAEAALEKLIADRRVYSPKNPYPALIELAHEAGKTTGGAVVPKSLDGICTAKGVKVPVVLVEKNAKATNSGVLVEKTGKAVESKDCVIED